MGGRHRVVLGALAAVLLLAGAWVCLAGGMPDIVDMDWDHPDTVHVPAAPGVEPAPEPGAVGLDPLAPVLEAPETTPDRTRLADSPDTWTVRVRAHRGRDQVFAGARLQATIYKGYEAKGEPLHETLLTSGEDGAAAWRLPAPAHAVTVQVGSADDDVVGGKVSKVVLEGDDGGTLDVYLFPLDHLVVGVVTNRDDKPVVGARVSWSQFLPPRHTDDQGRFQLRMASAHTRLVYYVVAPGYSRFMESLQLDGPGTTNVQVRLGPGFRAFGKVTDTDGRPLEGAKVSTAWWRYTGEETLTDVEGNYQLDTLDLSRDTRYVVATLDGYGRTYKQARGPGTEARIDLVLKRSATVTGTVFGPDGKPLGGARVGVSRSGRPTGPNTVVTGDDGHFALAPNPQGKNHYLWTWRRGFAVDRRPISLTGEGSATHVLVHLQRGHFVAGRVTDGEGRPVSGARLSAYLDQRARLGLTASTDEDGRYRLEDLPEAKLWMSAHAPGHVTLRRQEIALDSEHVDVVLQRSAQLRGRVVDGRTGAPIQDFHIRVLKWSRGGMSGRWYRKGQRFQDTDGYWETSRERIEPGASFDLQAYADGYAPTVRKNVTAAGDVAPDAILFQMFAGVVLRGQVLDRATGRPVPEARVTLLRPGRRRLHPSMVANPNTRSAADGTFAFEHVASGDLLLKVEHLDSPPFLHGPITMPATGTTNPVIVLLGTAGRIEGVLRDPEGRGLARVKVKLTPGPVGQRQLWLRRKTSVTDSAGGFRFDGLVNTDYVLNASSDGADGVSSVYRTEVQVKGDGPTRVVMKLPGACSITGTVRFLGPAGTDVRVQIYRRSDLAGVKAKWQSFGAGVKAGRFTVRGLPEGIYNFATVYRLNTKRQSHNGPKNVRVQKGAPQELSIQIPPR